MSDSLRPHGLQPSRLFCSWNFPSKNTGVGFHFLLQGIFLTQVMEGASLESPALVGGFFTTSATWGALRGHKVKKKVKVKSLSLTGSSVMGFSRQEYWSVLPFPPPGDLPDPGNEPGSPAL